MAFTLCEPFAACVRRETNAAQALFGELRQSRTASPATHATLQKLLDAVEASHLGVSRDDAARITGRCGVAHQAIYTGEDMTLCIFLLRRGASIPLHDHPGMHVFGRLLFGRMKVLSFDLLGSAGERGSIPASCQGETTLGPEPVTYGLSPDKGNIHELQAIDDCAFFDILTPPYDPARGRDCTYYRLEQSSATPGCFLTPVRYPAFSMDVQEYRGPVF
eukprot:TRINITY_DN17307_c0_g1_i1.p1 TRINITY_DN17307_c0_g1~~TRINITY_DN17307_c0_g1_i1.p1  ORF type:complete len:219 (+),score=25.98 TRINITY_DN17307_c0_g1_i1:137-793(+)